MSEQITAVDLKLLGEAIEVAGEAGARGDYPFGCVLADSEGTVIGRFGNSCFTSGDPTAHAEVGLMRDLGMQALGPVDLSKCTVYVNAEPCPMCAATMYFGGVRRIIFALGDERCRQITSRQPDAPHIEMEVRDLLGKAVQPVVILGPALEDEAAKVVDRYINGPN
ncbi:nucleoside deaminase [Kribbella turkmenica]|uniref:Nucleoside deaminase n=1 Tax=Kribbella turkmenica TaxID=2530375 RepID=A0A4R4XEM8_9ACTN|nr:nucleoside deaminase [Kribbella turkmenica]TDD29203.1 nucleoside deaminase [Kribbella turkmenica]